ncbi:UNVERIFIED_CONTAM: hypothetical protein RF653_05995 [Kocuria sp. CPCC 205316]|uniref:hypothetical protein n=1 Tax=Kocuria TaxID=57493 RepID=UPI0036DF65B1
MDDPWGEEQARLLHQALTRAGITLEQLWPFYLHLGGAAHSVEIEAYLHNSLKLPRAQRDLLAHAANLLIARLPPPQAPYSTELQAHHPNTSYPPTRPHPGTGHEDTLCTPETASPPYEAPPTDPSA